MSEFLCLLTGFLIFFSPVLLLILLSRRNTQLKRFADAHGMTYYPGLMFFQGARATGEWKGVPVRIRVHHNWYRRFGSRTGRKSWYNSVALTFYEADLRGIIPPGLFFMKRPLLEWPSLREDKVGLEEIEKNLFVRTPDVSIARDFFLYPAVRQALLELARRDDSIRCERGMLSITHLFVPTNEGKIRQHLDLIAWAGNMIRSDFGLPDHPEQPGQTEPNHFQSQ